MIFRQFFEPGTCTYTYLLGGKLQVGEIEIKVLHTQGHTSGCTSYVIEDRLFSGDSLLINGCGRTDFQQGDPASL